MRQETISFPRMGNYDVILAPLLEDLCPESRILLPPPHTNESLALGECHSPDDICAPFKYNVGGYIQSLEAGATVLLQTGTGCRFAYYAAVQERILRDLGYRFRMIVFNQESLGKHIPDTLQSLGCPYPVPKALRRLLLAFRAMRLLERFEFLLRERKGYAAKPEAFETLHREFLKDLRKVHSTGALEKVKAYYLPALRGLALHKPEKPLRVGVVGELFTVMEPAANFHLEDTLASYGIAVTRFMDAGYLLLGRRLRPPLKRTRGYSHFDVGATGPDTVAHCVELARRRYDGILHIKSFGCVPELNVMSALRRLSQDADIPIIHLSFDTTTAEAGLQTRLEAFADMIRMRREQGDAKPGLAGRGHRFHIHQGRGGE